MDRSVTIDGRELTLTSLERVVYPVTGTTKGQVLDYYAHVAPVMLPHVRGRPLTVKRWPAGTSEDGFFQKQIPKHAPDWIASTPIETASRTTDFPVIRTAADIVWFANIGALEFHIPQHRIEADGAHDLIVVDLDPGAGMDLIEVGRAAQIVCTALESIDLDAFVKVSGGSGMQVYAPIAATEAERCLTFSKLFANKLVQKHPDLFVSNMRKDLRDNKVLIDWSQNATYKTTIAPYSLRGADLPLVSAPIARAELVDATSADDEDALRFDLNAAMRRIDQLGDLFASLTSDSRAVLPI